MPNDISDYQEALRTLEQTRDNARTVSAIIRNAADRLRGWESTVVSGTSAVFPPYMLRSRLQPSIDARTWPTAQQLADALVAYHNANEAARNAWEKIPEERRAGLKPPPV